MPAISEETGRKIVAQRSASMCELAIEGVCLGRQASVHHRAKRSHGGTWAPSNLLAACGDGTRGCHGHVEAHPSWARERGLWLFTGDGDPDDVAVYMRWMNLMSWFTLDDEGLLSWAGGEWVSVPAGAATG